MNPSVFGALRGPIMLMAIGAMFAADQMDRIGIGRTWPVLLILFGVMKLVEHLLRRDSQSPPPTLPPSMGVQP